MTRRTTNGRVGAFLIAGLLVTVLLAGVVSSFASSSPDGLERVAIDNGFDHTADDHALADAPTADYAVRGVDDEHVSTGVAGVIGVTVTFAVAGGAVFIIQRVRRRPAAVRS